MAKLSFQQPLLITAITSVSIKVFISFKSIFFTEPKLLNSRVYACIC